ncbi:hypothetical protein BDV32DRAFT_150070 [Aspergillus pseudonomiae]|nr:hypothetical protein BDV32DRAFT_150070 [Aspergillus pseudonomiae]
MVGFERGALGLNVGHIHVGVSWKAVVPAPHSLQNSTPSMIVAYPLAIEVKPIRLACEDRCLTWACVNEASPQCRQSGRHHYRQFIVLEVGKDKLERSLQLFELKLVDEHGKHLASLHQWDIDKRVFKSLGISGGLAVAQIYLLLSSALVQHVARLVDVPNACMTMGLMTDVFDFHIRPEAVLVPERYEVH